MQIRIQLRLIDEVFLYLPAESITSTSSGIVVHQFLLASSNSRLPQSSIWRGNLKGSEAGLDSPAKDNQQKMIQITIPFAIVFPSLITFNFVPFVQGIVLRWKLCVVTSLAASSTISPTVKVSGRCWSCSRHYFSCRIMPIRLRLFTIVRRKAKREQKQLFTNISARSLQCSSNWSASHLDYHPQLPGRFVDRALEAFRRWNSF